MAVDDVVRVPLLPSLDTDLPPAIEQRRPTPATRGHRTLFRNHLRAWTFRSPSAAATRQVFEESSELPTDNENGTLAMSENRLTVRTDEIWYAVNVCAVDNSE
jgi:hypothetical protein